MAETNLTRISITIPEHLAYQARVIAARQNTSRSAFISTLVAKAIRSIQQPQQPDAGQQNEEQ